MQGNDHSDEHDPPQPNGERPLVINGAEQIVDEILERVGRRLVVGAPLGLGKADRLLDALYRRAKDDPSIELTIHTALGLVPPRSANALEARLREPMNDRLFGPRQADLFIDQRSDALPSNVTVHTFYFDAGAALGAPIARRDRVDSNYSDVARQMPEIGANVFLQMIAPGERYSLSCNPDLTIELIEHFAIRRAAGDAVVMCGEFNENLPWMGGDAAVDPGVFDLVLDAPAPAGKLFVVPNMPIAPVDHIIGAHAASLFADDGTAQFGIGALGDAVVWMLILRHRRSNQFARLVDAISPDVEAERATIARIGGTGRFDAGLYGSSEMFVPGLLELIEEGVVSRAVSGDIGIERARAAGVTVDDPTGGHLVHAGFFLGPEDFYERLRAMVPAERDRMAMTDIGYVNTLDGDHELKMLQRRNARFVNTAMQVTLAGATASDTLDDGRVVSGVGGQFDFVEMARHLPGGRSVILVRSVREKGRPQSNIVLDHRHVTSPAHLRDLVVTEYGVADLRGQPAGEVAARLIAIADSRFQEEIVAAAKQAGVLAPDFEVPVSRRDNTPESLARRVQPWGEFLPALPFGSAITDDEIALGKALQHLDALMSSRDPRRLDGQALRALVRPPRRTHAALARMGLDHPGSIGERLERRLVAYGLLASGALDHPPARRPDVDALRAPS